MLSPIIRRSRTRAELLATERGFTMALVTVALVSIIAMAALSIDIGTLYQAKAEAQRAADAAALTAARIISISGITGDPSNGSNSWQKVCGGAGSPASMAAINVAQQNPIGGNPASTVKVYYGTSSGVGTNEDCSDAKAGFGVNPIVEVYVQQAKLPTFFARVFSMIPGGTSSNSGVSTNAAAEVFNSSYLPGVSGAITPVQPRCVKPLVIPNSDLNGGNFLDPNGSISNGGVLLLKKGVIGETFNLNADCASGASNCYGKNNLLNNPPQWSTNSNGNYLEYVPALISGNPGALPSCSPATGFQAAITGCDQTTVYACGTPNGAQVDLRENPVTPGYLTGDTSTAVACLTQSAPTYKGADNLVMTSFPFQIQAGLGNPMVQQSVVSANDIITTSNSIVTIPIYDGALLVRLKGQAHPDVTIVGFLQVFINGVNSSGDINVTVLNVAGCGNNSSNTPVNGTSPVPVRLITPP